MQIRCYRCGWSFAIKKDEAAFALQALEETGGTHYDSSCPRCRHSNRISLEQLRKAAPGSADDPSSAEGQVTEESAEDEGAEPEAADESVQVDSDETGSEATDQSVQDGSDETGPEAADESVQKSSRKRRVRRSRTK